MPRVTTVAHARKPPGSCGKCGVDIPVGAPYRHWSFRYGGKRIRCMAPACSPRNSDLTQSKYAEVWAAVESAEDTIGAWTGTDGAPGDLDEVIEALREAAEAGRDVASEYESAADAMEQNGGSAGEESRERASALESWADTVEGFSFDEPPEAGCDTCDSTGKIDCPDADNDNHDATCTRANCDGMFTCGVCDGMPDEHYDADAVAEWEDAVREEAMSALNEGFEA